MSRTATPPTSPAPASQHADRCAPSAERDRSPVRLRSGTLVHARGDGLLQVGSDPARRALIPDTQAVRGLLHLLERGIRLDTSHELAPVTDALRRAGVLVEPLVVELLREARECTRVAVEVPAPFMSIIDHLLALAGLGRTPPDEAEAADVLLRVVQGPGAPLPASEGIESDRATLEVRVVDSRVRVGPFATPGRTACSGCIRAHEQDADPWAVDADRWAPLVGSVHDDEGDVDLLVLHMALASAAQDLVAWAEGRQPLTWSATHWIDASQQTHRQVWARHPHCGCSWDDALDA